MNISEFKKIEEDILKGEIQIGSKKVILELSLEDREDETCGFDQLLELAKKFATYFTDEKQKELEGEFGEEIVDSVYEEDEEYEVSEKDYAALQSDLKIIAITVYEDAFMLKYTAEKQFPDEEIVVQLNDDYSIEDIAIYV